MATDTPGTSFAAVQSEGIKRDRNDDSDSESEDDGVKKPTVSGKYYAARLNSSRHGNVYRLKLLTLFVLRALQKNFRVKLATGIVDAKNFDDVAFYYQNEHKEKMIRFLQANHKQDEAKTITYSDLLSEAENADFSLKKYFISYRKMKKNPEFERYKLKDFVICTNIDLDENLTWVESITGEDDILYFKNCSKEVKRLKLDESEFFKVKELKSTLIRSSEVYRLARILAICVRDKEPLELRDDLMKAYHSALEEKVIKRMYGKDVGQFREEFTDFGKSPELEKFRKAFYEEYLSVSKREMDENEFWKEMKSTQLTISSDFGKKYGNLTYEKGQLHMKTDLPNDRIDDTDIDNFLNDLVFAVNLPNEFELGNIIKDEIGDFDVIDSEMMANQFQNNMLTWMTGIIKDKNAPFLTKKDLEKLFDEIQQEICNLKIVSVTLFHKRKVSKFDISFSEDLEGIKNFLTSDRVGTRICNLVCTHDTIFGSIKVVQILKKLDAYRKDDSHIFMYLQDILLLEDHEIKAFNSATINLLVIECKAQQNNKSVSNLFVQLKPAIFGKNKDKKVLLITLENDFLAKLFADYCSQNKDEACSYTKIKDERNSFTDLDEESQKKILMRKIIFQGKKTNVGTVIGSESTHLLSGDMLSKLIKNKKIEIPIAPVDSQVIIKPDFCKYGKFFINDDKQPDITSINHSHGDFVSISDTSEVFDTPIYREIEDKGTKNCQRKIKKDEVLILGKEVSFGAVVDAESAHPLSGEVVSMLIKNDEIGKPPIDPIYIEVEDYFIDRTFIRNVIIKTDFRKCGNFFIVDDKQRDTTSIDLSHGDIISISDTSEVFEELCQELTQHNIHWLKKEDDQFIWQKSRGDLTQLRELVDYSEKSVKIYKPNQITDIPDRVVLLTAEPGMGKSVLLSHLALKTRSVSPSVWIIRINLVDYTTNFSNWLENGTEINMLEAMKFLCEISNLQNFKYSVDDEQMKNIIHTALTEENIGMYPTKNMKGLSLLELKLFIHFFHHGKVILLFDGFDEICPDYKDLVVELLKIIKDNTKVEKIWLTTRPYNILSELENQLSTFSYALMPFDEKEKGNFLNKFWKKNLKVEDFDEERANIFLDELLNQFSKAINDPDRKFTSIPLQIYMIANLFSNAFEKFYSSKNRKLSQKNKEAFAEKLDLVMLYETFLETKIDIEKKKVYSSDYLKKPGAKHVQEVLCSKFRKSHEILAMCLIFKKDQLEKVLLRDELEKIKESIEYISKAKMKTGVICKIVDDKPKFIHCTFADYLAAQFIWKKFNYSKIDKFEEKIVHDIVIEMLIKEDATRVSKFLQLISLKGFNSGIDFSTWESKIKILLKELIDQIKDYGAKMGDNIQSPKLLLGIIEFFLLKQREENKSKIKKIHLKIRKNNFQIRKNNLNIRKNNFKIRKNNLEVRKNHLEIRKNHFEIMKSHLEIRRNHLEIRQNHLEIRQNHLEMCRMNNLKIRKNNFEISDHESLKLLCVCAEMGYTKLAQRLMKNLSTECFKLHLSGVIWSHSPLWIAARNHHLDIIKLLVENSSYSTAWGDKYGTNLIECALKYQCYDVLKSCSELSILDCGPSRNLDHADITKFELPIYIAIKKHAPPEVIKLLIENTDADLVNTFIHGGCKVPMCADIMILELLTYDKRIEIMKLAIRKGINFSFSMNTCFSKLYDTCFRNPVHRSASFLNDEPIHLLDSWHFKENFSNLFSIIELLLKSGVGYSCPDNPQLASSTYGYVRKIYYLHKFLDAVYKLHEQKIGENCELTQIMLKLFIYCIKSIGFKGVKIVINPDETSILPRYEDELPTLSERIISEIMYKVIRTSDLIMVELFSEYYKNRDSNWVKNALNKLNGRQILMEGRECGNSDPSFENEIFENFKERNFVQKLWSDVTLLHCQGYEYADAVKEISEKVLKFENIINKLLEMKKNLRCEEDNIMILDCDNILEVLDLKHIDCENEDTQYLIQELGSYPDILDGLVGTYARLNNLGKKKLTKVFEQMLKFSDQSTLIFELYEPLHESYKNFIRAVANDRSDGDTVNSVLKNVNQDFLKAVINGLDTEYGSPLHYAAFFGQEEITSIILQNGANPNLRLCNNAEKIKYFPQAVEKMKTNPFLPNNFINWTPLYFALLNGHQEIVQELINYGAVVNPVPVLDHRSQDDYTQFLIPRNYYGAVINPVLDDRSQDGYTPLHSKDGYSPLHISALTCGHLEIVRLLLEKGAIYNAQNGENKTPLDLATVGSDIHNLLYRIDRMFQTVTNGEKDAVNSLLEEIKVDWKAVLNARNADGKTLLNLARGNEQEDIAELLIEKSRSIA